MKKTIVAVMLLLSIGAGAQTPKYTSKADSIAKNTMMVSYFFEYFQACFNDSTPEYYYVSCPDGDCFKVPCNKGKLAPGLGEICPEHWIHKKRTFEDFIQWLYATKRR